MFKSGKRKYKKIAKIGEGAHGVVFKCEVIEDKKKSRKKPRRKERPIGKYVALKKIRIRSTTEGLSLEAIREIKLLQEIDHPNVVKLYDVFSKGSDVNLVLEFMSFDLENIIKEDDIVLTRADIKSYMQMLLLGIEACHRNWIVHRDIKPENLLIGPDGQMKLGDFGLAITYGSPDRQLWDKACTIWYRAPELLFGGKYYGAAMDMWSIGCIFGELMTRAPLFPGQNEIDQLSHILGKLGSPSEQEWEGLKYLQNYLEFEHLPVKPLQELFTGASKSALDLLSKLLLFNPQNRITVADALDHPFFSDGESPTPPHALPRPKKARKKEQET